jgi:ABC-type multidrug transport system fused ATPase/permease subunit
MDSDKVVIMNDGIIAEYGTPRELITERNELFTEDEPVICL